MPDAERSFTINEFCQLERICRATYYNLRRAGLGPDEILVGSHRRITAAARRRWHQGRSAPPSAATEVHTQRRSVKKLVPDAPGPAEDLSIGFNLERRVGITDIRPRGQAAHPGRLFPGEEHDQLSLSR